MLDCTVDDMIHWGSIGAVELCCRLNELPVLMSVFNDKYENIEWSPKDEFFAFSPFSKANFDEIELSLQHHGSISGFWPITTDDIELIETNNSISLMFSNYLLPFDKSLKVHCIVNNLSSDDDMRITQNDLWITSDNLKKLHDAIHSDIELPNIYNNTELAEKGKIFSAPQPSGRVTNKQSSMIKSLILLNPNISKELIDRPYELFTELVKMFAKANIPCPVSDGNTLKNWLERAK